ncbi:hypothetical protein CVT25_009666 [Psilocybe cyanescens]|uniref:Uncharacterized protein n=1 Tax=Psilocybe cyanescens TaxID=93625 RepID=A0A409XP10_PSICY|nr:hypothetical protein CVT25_009666 [Psilocybe cyanescens]
MRLPSSASMRVGSRASSVGPSVPGPSPSPIITSTFNVNRNNANTNTIADNTLSVGSVFYATRTPSSVLSSGSSLRPLSMTLTNSRMSHVSSLSANSGNSGHSGSGANGREKEVDAGGDGEDKGSEKERRTSIEGRRLSEGPRTALIDVLPEVQVRRLLDGVGAGGEAHHDAADEAKYRKRQKERDSASIKHFSYSILTIEEATSDGHGRACMVKDVGSEEMAGGAAEEFGFKAKENAEADAAPVKKGHAGSLLEQTLGGSGPKTVYHSDVIQRKQRVHHKILFPCYAGISQASQSFPLRFPRHSYQWMSNSDIGSGHQSGVSYTPNSRFHPSGQKPWDASNINIDGARVSSRLV